MLIQLLKFLQKNIFIIISFLQKKYLNYNFLNVKKKTYILSLLNLLLDRFSFIKRKKCHTFIFAYFVKDNLLNI